MTVEDVIAAMAICGYCGGPCEILPEPARFRAPDMTWSGPGQKPVFDGWRWLWGAVYFRDPFHHPGKPFVNYCSARCSLADAVSDV